MSNESQRGLTQINRWGCWNICEAGWLKQPANDRHIDIDRLGWREIQRSCAGRETCLVRLGTVDRRARAYVTTPKRLRIWAAGADMLFSLALKTALRYVLTFGCRLVRPLSIRTAVTDIPLSDDDWNRVKHLFNETASSRGRPRRDARQILNAILWVLQTGEKWHRLPANFPPQQTCYAKYMAWRREGVLQRAAELLGMPAGG